MPFLDWIMGHVGDKTAIGKVAEILIDIQHNILEPSKVEAPDLETILAFAETVPALSIHHDAIIAAHREWDEYTRR
jgi:hypothetical protein